MHSFVRSAAVRSVSAIQAVRRGGSRHRGPFVKLFSDSISPAINCGTDENRSPSELTMMSARIYGRSDGKFIRARACFGRREGLLRACCPVSGLRFRPRGLFWIWHCITQWRYAARMFGLLFHSFLCIFPNRENMHF